MSDEELLRIIKTYSYQVCAGAVRPEWSYNWVHKQMWKVVERIEAGR